MYNHSNLPQLGVSPSCWHWAPELCVHLCCVVQPAELWTHWPESFCCGPQKKASAFKASKWLTGSLSPAHIQESAIVNSWLTSSGALHLQTGPLLYVLNHFPNTCSLKSPKYMFLDIPLDVIRSVTRFRLHVHTLCYETATCEHMSSTMCYRCESFFPS